MGEHPIENLMNTAMNSIKDMIDVNTIIGEPIQASNNTVIIPISKVGFGFAAGGSEFRGETIDEYTKKEKEEQVQYRLLWSRSKYNTSSFLSCTTKHCETIASRP